MGGDDSTAWTQQCPYPRGQCDHAAEVAELKKLVAEKEDASAERVKLADQRAEAAETELPELVPRSRPMRVSTRWMAASTCHGTPNSASEAR